MTFLEPMAGLVGAALAVPVFLLLYFLKLRRRPVRVSSTMLWESAVRDVQVNAPFRWIRFSVLLLLQAAALAALLMALARPVLGGNLPLGQRVVIVIDRSASMSAVDGRGDSGVPVTRLDEAKREAERLVDLLARSGGRGNRGGGWISLLGGGTGSASPQGMVVALGAEARALTGFVSDQRDLRGAVSAIEGSDQAGGLEPLVRLLQGVTAGDVAGETVGAANAAAENEPVTVYVISDGGLNAAESALSERFDVRYVRVGGQSELDGTEGAVGNLGIVAASALRSADDPQMVRVFARLINTGKQAASAVVRARLGELDQRGMLVGGAAGESTRAAVVEVPGASNGDGGPGSATVTIELARAGESVGLISLEGGDKLAADDAAGFVVPAGRRPRVLLVHPDDREADLFLRNALEALELPDGYLRLIDATGYERSEAERRIGGGGQAWYDVVLFDRVAPRRSPPAPSLSFGGGLPEDGVLVEDPPKDAEGYARFSVWRRTHPVLRHVALDDVVIAPAQRVRGAGDDGAEEQGWTVLARGTGRSGPLIVLLGEGEDAFSAGVARVPRVVVGFAISRSTWGASPSFPIFIENALGLLAARTRRTGAIVTERSAGAGMTEARAFTTSEVVRLAAPPGVSRVSILSREQAERSLSVESEGPGAMLGPADRERGGIVSLGVLERVGIYAVRPEGGSGDRVGVAGRALGGGGGVIAVPVNLLSEAESSLRVSPVLMIGGRAIPAVNGTGGAGEVSIGPERAIGQLTPGAGRERTGDAELWHWFILAACGLLTVEWCVYAASARR